MRFNKDILKTLSKMRKLNPKILDIEVQEYV